MVQLSCICNGLKGSRLISKLKTVRSLRAVNRDSNPITLLPPWLTTKEIRVFTHLPLDVTLTQCGIEKRNRNGSGWFWRDHDSREFYTESKTDIHINYATGAAYLHQAGLIPSLVDPEPHWTVHPPSILSPHPSIPVIAVLGHINHGKTTLIDRLTGLSRAKEEPGQITQRVDILTIGGEKLWKNTISSNKHGLAQKQNHKLQFPSTTFSHFSFLDTPGHSVFKLLRGRATSLADVALILISADQKPDKQTREVLIQADRFGTSVLFVLTKTDKPTSNVQLVKQELRNQCLDLLDEGLIENDLRTVIDQSTIEISAIKKIGLQKLVASILKLLEHATLPISPPQSECLTLGKAAETTRILRRSDVLIGVEENPSCIGVILDYTKDETGKRITLLVRLGADIKEGSWFVCGSAVARVGSMIVSCPFDQHVPVGPGIGLLIYTDFLDGDVVPDDVALFLSEYRAKRLASYRRRIELLSQAQIAGPSLNVHWMADSPLLNTRQKNCATNCVNDFKDVNKHGENNSPVEKKNPMCTQISDIERDIRCLPDDVLLNLETQSIFVPPDTDHELKVRKNISKTNMENQIKMESPNGSGPLFSSISTSSLSDDNGTFFSDLEETNVLVDRFGTVDDNNNNNNNELEDSKYDMLWHTLPSSQIRVNTVNSALKPEEFPPPKSPSPSLATDISTFQLRFPFVVRALNASGFDAILSGIEEIEAEFSVSIPIVHGGLGPVSRNDIAHASIEQKRKLPYEEIRRKRDNSRQRTRKATHCHVVSLGVGVRPEAAKEALNSKIEIRRFNVVTDLLRDIRYKVKHEIYGQEKERKNSRVALEYKYQQPYGRIASCYKNKKPFVFE